MKDGTRPKSWRHALWTFIKAQLSAQLATLTDFVVTVALAKLVGIYYLYATFIGSVAGGVLNCIVNYGWVFHAGGNCKKRYVAIKYFIVWGCSILLNTWGTFFLTEWLRSMKWVNGLLGHYVNDVFILSKIIVAVLVAFFWNYHMQRLFVYRNHEIWKFIRHCFKG